MHTQRVISGAILIPIIIGFIAWGEWPYRILILLVTLIAAAEFVQMFRGLKIRLGLLRVLGLTLAWEIDSLLPQSWGHLPLATVAILGLTLYELVVARHNQSQSNATEQWGLSLAMGTYLGIGGAHLIGLRSLPDGLWWVLTTLIIVWVSDSAAYYAGSRWGRHKMAPSISPGKSWEGYVAQVASGFIVGALTTWLWPIVFARMIGSSTTLTPWRGLWLGGIVSIFCPAGDFLISMMKRAVGVKDTSNLIPGHGGVLDRIDSVVWAGMLAHLLAQAFI